nr:hypothetical protein [Quatrionicoccus australiensis]
MIRHGAVSSIWFNQGTNFCIKSGNLTRANSHLATISQRQVHLGAIGGDYAFAFTNDISDLEAAQLAGTVTSKSFSGDG